MDIIIACIGHMKPSPELDLLSKYIKQTRWNVVVREFEDKNPVPSKSAKTRRRSSAFRRSRCGENRCHGRTGKVVIL